jgi:hypothetical protein
LGIGQVGHVLAGERVGNELPQHLPKPGDRFWAIDLKLLSGRQQPGGQQLLDDQQHGTVAGQEPVVFQGFAVVAAADAEGLGGHHRAVERIHDAVEGDQAKRLLHLGAPLGQEALDVGLKCREISKRQVLHMGRLRRGRNPQGLRLRGPLK